jgi:hypothetical protein
MEAARKTAEPTEDLWMSQPQAARALGCSRHGVLAAIAKGELVPGLVAGRSVVSRASVDALVASREAAVAAEGVHV